jgi:hypothetical protein
MKEFQFDKNWRRSYISFHFMSKNKSTLGIRICNCRRIKSKACKLLYASVLLSKPRFCPDQAKVPDFTVVLLLSLNTPEPKNNFIIWLQFHFLENDIFAQSKQNLHKQLIFVIVGNQQNCINVTRIRYNWPN